MFWSDFETNKSDLNNFKMTYKHVVGGSDSKWVKISFVGLKKVKLNW